jgi:predicted glycosyltransferase
MIWFDLDNSPHVPLFRPILCELKKRNVDYFVTARDFAQTKDLLRYWNIEHILVGVHGGRNKVGKIVNLLQRSNRLTKEIRGKEITLAVSHGSRTQLVAAKGMGIPSILMVDYEYTERKIFNFLASWLLVPSLIPEQRLAAAGFNLRKVVRYTGFKEEIYLKDFVPDLAFRKQIGLSDDQVLVTLRPPSTTSNYHEGKSERLFQQCLEHFSTDSGTVCLVMNRTDAELDLIPASLRKKENISILSKPVDGLQLLWHSDIVVSGGGTVNREAALLGIPTYSIFTGRRPYLDEYLQEIGKLKFLESSVDINSVEVHRRNIGYHYQASNPELVFRITDLLLELGER